MKLYINGEQIPLQRYGGNTQIGKAEAWYHIFGPDYFEEGGVYFIRWEFWIKRPYQNDNKTYWRIFVDYNGKIEGLDPGAVLADEWYLNIVA